jgi:uncharacterized protein YyaL (SSP411 family)
MAVQSLEGTNRLKDEPSPYLLQHAKNPVDWYPWSEEATQRARAEDKPMLLSIGYSSCHWCHVMAHESFEDAETARLMNENFINIKIDKEERPDLNDLYMKAVQAMSVPGGWPLTVFTTPEGVPFYGGTYFPLEEGRGMPSFKRVLTSIKDAYGEHRADIEKTAVSIKEALVHRRTEAPVEPGPELSEAAAKAASLYHDPVNGGFGTGTKFPHAMYLKFLLMYHARTGEPGVLDIVTKTLSAMASGGMYDQLGGGFHRYSVDERWEVPHFEKMLYDNALLAGLYARGYAATGSEFFRDTSLDTIGYLLREMRSAEGGFYSAQDADVEGSEGGYYVWRPAEITGALGDDGKRFIEYFSVTQTGNFEGSNTLRIAPKAKEPYAPVDDVVKRLKSTLLRARRERNAPQTDRKVIVAWNALAIEALALASKAFDRPDLLSAAIGSASFLLSSLNNIEGRLSRYWLDGVTRGPAVLQDYALLGVALHSIYEATDDKRWLEEAVEKARSMTALFYDEVEGVFFDTGKDRSDLFIRTRDLFDNDAPSGNSAAADLLLRLSVSTGSIEYKKLATTILGGVEQFGTEPLSYGNFLCVLERLLTA